MRIIIIIVTTASTLSTKTNIPPSPADHTAAACFNLQIVNTIDQADQPIKKHGYILNIRQRFARCGTRCQGKPAKGLPQPYPHFFRPKLSKNTRTACSGVRTPISFKSTTIAPIYDQEINHKLTT